MSSKDRLRVQARARLAALRPDEIAAAGARVEASVWSLPEVRSARLLLLYASLGSEVPTDSIAIEAHLRGIRVAYPRCLPDGLEMSLHSVSSLEELLQGGRFGIREPATDCPRVGVGEVDVAFLPGLAWDRRGGRLGRGAGYYDRLLAHPEWRALRCGLFFSTQELPALPLDPWDRRLDVVVTEQEIVRVPSIGERAESS